MKTTIRLLTCAVVAAMSMEAAKAAINIPSDGSDGALVIAADTVIDLSQAVTGNWDANNAANAGKGIYDPAKWAVVFKYSSVTIQGGATVTFKNHASRAPVVWLVQGDVTIDGTVNLDGQGQQPPPLLAEPGPGGFRGGSGNYAPGAEDAPGFGPGGGQRRFEAIWYAHTYGGGGGSYGSLGVNGSSLYGNPSLIPLIGGSGAGGRQNTGGQPVRGGGAGGGAILIASSGTLTIVGAIHANGGSGVLGSQPSDDDAAGGSGGGIRLVCEVLAGNGNVQCVGGKGFFNGGLGRIRLERVTASTASSFVVAPDPSVVELTSGATPQIWLPANGPSVRILSIDGNSAPVDPRAEFGAIGADVVIPTVTNTTVVVETTNVEQASVVTVRATPRSDGNFTEATAAVTSVVTEDPLVVRWTANVPVKDGYAAIQVKVVRP